MAVWGLGDLGLRIQRGDLSLAKLFDEDMLGDDLEAWLAESALMKRTFRTCAIIAGLIEKRFPGEEKSRRQLTISTDLVYDVLRKHQADHILLRAARADAATGLLDIKRLGEMLSRIKGRIVHKALGPRLAAVGSGAAGDRPRDRLRRGVRRTAGRGGGRVDQGGDAVIFPAHSRASGNPEQSPGSPLPRGRADHVVTLAAVALTADRSGGLYWPEQGLLAVADLHLEKGSSFAARGQLLPPYDTAATLARLGRLVAHYAPRVVIARRR